MPYIGYVLILLICLVVALVTFGKVRPRTYPFILYAIAASMVLMMTLAGPRLVGGDVHHEYWLAQYHAGKDVLAPTVATAQATTIGNTVIAPWLHKLFHIPLLWIYKVVYPLIFATIPVILYFVYRKWIDGRKAFLASFLFIAMPAFLMELPSIAREMTAEVALAVVLYLLVVSRLRHRYKVPLLVGCALLIPMLHYSTSIVFTVMLGMSLLTALVLRSWKHVKVIGLVLGTVVLVGSVYFSTAQDGFVIRKLESLYNNLAPVALQVDEELLPGAVTPKKGNPEIEVPETVVPEDPGSDGVTYKLSRLAGMALGLDFMSVDNWGRLLRVLQWCILAGVGIGLWKLRRNKEYVIFVSGAILILALCLVPGWSSILNATRFAHFGMFLLAPALIASIKREYLLLVVLVPYFLFSSGFIFEATQQPNLEYPAMPYSYALSNHRMDMGATLTKDDVKVREYIIENNLIPINSDMWGAYFISEVVGLKRPDITRSFAKTPRPLEGYIFVRGRSIQEGTFTMWSGIGCRKFVEPEELGIDWNENVVYQSGDARVLEVK